MPEMNVTGRVAAVLRGHGGRMSEARADRLAAAVVNELGLIDCYLSDGTPVVGIGYHKT